MQKLLYYYSAGTALNKYPLHSCAGMALNEVKQNLLLVSVVCHALSFELAKLPETTVGKIRNISHSQSGTSEEIEA